MCICPSVDVYACLSLCAAVCMLNICLLVTLSTSPQCDNWLPGELVSLLLIIVIPSRKRQGCVRWYSGSLLVCRENWSLVCLDSFGTEKETLRDWDSEADRVKPGCRLRSGVVSDQMPWSKLTIWGRWCTMEKLASIGAMSLNAIARLYYLSSGEQNKSQRELCVLNQTCRSIS